MNILDKIIVDKKKEVVLKKQVISGISLTHFPLFERETVSLATALKKSESGIIAEHKRRSPSKSVINHDLNVQDVALGYQKAGVCGMSVLTDGKYFGGSLDDMVLARAAVALPLLRKDFIIDEYQILEAKAFGADVILLIAAVLTRAQINDLATFAKSLNLEVLLEIHNEEELEKSLIPQLDMIGVNNRNLKTFEVTTETSKALSQIIPQEYVKVSESGISNIETIQDLKNYGFHGFLVGENFMKTNDPGKSAAGFISDLQTKTGYKPEAK